MKRSLQALGRLKKGTMNRTEERYERDVLRTSMIAGTILWYRFEGIKLRLADNTFLTVDFAVMNRDCGLEMHDVKGSVHVFTDDARVKMKCAADQYPFVFKVAYPVPTAKGGGWNIEVVG